jgi:hypothetical protein
MGEMTEGAGPGPWATIIDRLAARRLGLSERSGRYRVLKNIPVPTRDGFQLATDHYAPESDDPAGTILVRTPYGRGFPGSLAYGRIFALAGYHVVIQSVRGTFGSTDDFQPFVREADDAQDAVSWIREQPWFDGHLGTAGGSYLGLTQWALLTDPPEELRASVIVVGPHDLSQAMYGSGAFALSNFLGWSDATAGLDSFGNLRRFVRMLTTDRRTAPGLYGLPLVDAAESVLKGSAPWFRQWLLHTDPTDPFWAPHSYGDAFARTHVPTLLVGGWQDAFLEQTLEQYSLLREREVDVALTVGPWTHMDTARKATEQITRESLDWLDEHVAGRSHRNRPSPVRIFITGADEWRDLPHWPPRALENYYYHLDDDGRLSELATSGASTFTYDPANPTPALGGRILSLRNAGVVDNRELEARADVLTFTSPPLQHDLEIVGRPAVELLLSVDNPHADIFVRVTDVDVRGRSRNIADGFVRLDSDVPAGHEQHVTVLLDGCAHRLVTGHRLRLQVSGGAHPRFARNLGTDEPLATGQRLVPSVHVVHHAESRVALPVMSARRYGDEMR